MPLGWKRTVRIDHGAVEAGAWWFRAVAWMIAAGIVFGVGLLVWSLLSSGGGGAS